MSSHLTPIDISNMPELARIVEEVAATKTPRELTRNNEIVAVLTPVKTEGKQQKKAIEETLALAGAWKDLDFDDMLEQLDKIRHESKQSVSWCVLRVPCDKLPVVLRQAEIEGNAPR